MRSAFRTFFIDDAGTLHHRSVSGQINLQVGANRSLFLRTS
jgi:hypothetical protein